MSSDSSEYVNDGATEGAVGSEGMQFAVEDTRPCTCVDSAIVGGQVIIAWEPDACEEIGQKCRMA